jgi:hypothetical protein
MRRPSLAPRSYNPDGPMQGLAALVRCVLVEGSARPATKTRPPPRFWATAAGTKPDWNEAETALEAHVEAVR